MLNRNSLKFFTDYVKASTVSRVKTNKFVARITVPQQIRNKLDTYEFLCEGVDFPFFTFNTVTEKYAHKINKSVNAIDYDPITLIFGIDSGLFGNNRAMNMFLDWAELIRPNNGLYGYLEDYAGTIEIDFLDDNLKTFKTAIINNAFPVNINNIALQLDDDSLATLDVSFEFSEILYENNVISNFLKKIL